MEGAQTGVLSSVASWSEERPRAEEARERLFSRVAEELTPALYRTALALLGNAADAEDAVQEAFLKGFRSFSRFRHEADIRTWLYRITVNLCRDAGRRKASRQRLLARLSALAKDETDAGPSPAEAAEAKATGQELTRLLAALDERHRVPLVLKHVAGQPVKEIATTLGVPEGTVKRRLSEAYRKLRDQLEKGGERND